MGMPAPIGTGIFKLLHQPMVIEEVQDRQPLLFETALNAAAAACTN